MSTFLDVIVAIVAIAAFGLSLRVYFRDKNLGEKTAELQRRIVEIEETRLAREEAQLVADNEAALRARKERAEAGRRAQRAGRSANFDLRFTMKSRDRGRLIATNNGPADASNVLLEVWGERGGGRQEVYPFDGDDTRRADRLQPRESIGYEAIFSLSSPRPEDLRYRLTWVDGNGDQEKLGRAPVN